MAALTAMKSFKQRLAGRDRGLTYEVEVVAQHATELPLPAGARAAFVLKRRHRLCVTDPAEVDGAGGVEWNTRCVQTATLQKEGGGGGGGWRPKEFVFKVQAVRDAPRLGREESVTVAKAALDLSQFCGAEPLGPKQLVLQLRPAGVLSVSVRTQWLQAYDREADSLTDLSYLSLAPSAMTSAVGGSGPGPQTEGEQDLSGFDGSAAAAAAAGAQGGIRAAYGPAAAPAAAGATPAKRRPSVLRLGSRRGREKEQLAPTAPQQAAQQQQPQQQQAAAAGGFQFAPADGGAAAAARRPPGASPLLLPGASLQGPAAAEAATPKLVIATRAGGGGGAAAAAQQGAAPAAGMPPECWSPINLKEAVDRLYDSEEEPTPRASVLGTVRRMFGRARNATPPLPPGTTARQLHETFGTPAPSPPKVAPDPAEVASLDREGSASALRRRCKRLLAERDEARAQGYAEAALAVEQGIEIDRLRRAKDMLLARLQVAEGQLLATYRDEAAADLIQALAQARVEGAQLEFRVLELQGQLRQRDGQVDRLRAALTRAEAKYRASLNACSPGAQGPSLSPHPADAGAASGAAPYAAKGQGPAVSDASAASVRPLPELGTEVEWDVGSSGGALHAAAAPREAMAA